ncbi:putative uncharacterized protein DDB_G0279653 isoform X2 [Symsagittifera roscoffensis]|uniref:putative uncharacterized protein DDB_G0279653 isoform X2 n=1 Tax=Symsagittifera roscoffensis TaxID=84072 RepID=UPI00307BA9E3
MEQLISKDEDWEQQADSGVLDKRIEELAKTDQLHNTIVVSNPIEAPEEVEAVQPVMQFKILKKKPSESSASPKSQSNKSAQAGDGGKGAAADTRTFEQREEDYLKARQRIFGDVEETKDDNSSLAADGESPNSPNEEMNMSQQQYPKQKVAQNSVNPSASNQLPQTQNQAVQKQPPTPQPSLHVPQTNSSLANNNGRVSQLGHKQSQTQSQNHSHYQQTRNNLNPQTVAASQYQQPNQYFHSSNRSVNPRGNSNNQMYSGIPYHQQQQYQQHPRANGNSNNQGYQQKQQHYSQSGFPHQTGGPQQGQLPHGFYANSSHSHASYFHGPSPQPHMQYQQHHPMPPYMHAAQPHQQQQQHYINNSYSNSNYLKPRKR